MQEFTPSWQEKIKAFQEWRESSTSRRVEIAERSNSEDGRGIVKVDDFLPLVKIPEFLAGVFDNRACISVNGSGNNRLKITSTNTSLIEALMIVYGGDLDFGMTKGDVIERTGRGPYVIKEDSFIWILGVKGYRQLASDPNLNLNSHLKLLQL